jgi:hypothetical protein
MGTKPGPNRAKVGPAGPTSLASRPGFGVFLKTISYTCQGRSVELVDDAQRRWRLRRLVGRLYMSSTPRQACGGTPPHLL